MIHPLANFAFLSLGRDTTLELGLDDILSYDGDGDADPDTLVITSAASNGLASPGGTASVVVVYVPDLDYYVRLNRRWASACCQR